MEKLIKVVNDGNEMHERRESILEEKQKSLEISLNKVAQEQSRMEGKIDRLIHLVQQGHSTDKGEVNVSFVEGDNSIPLSELDGVKSLNQNVDCHLTDVEGKHKSFFRANRFITYISEFNLVTFTD